MKMVFYGVFFNMFLRYFSDDAGHFFIQKVVIQEQTKNKLLEKKLVADMKKPQSATSSHYDTSTCKQIHP